MALAACLGPVQLDQHAVIDIRAERFLNGLQIRSVPVRGELDPVRQPSAQIIHQHQRKLGIASADRVGDQQLGFGFDRRPSPAVAGSRIARALAPGNVLLLRADEAPNFVTLDTGRFHAANRLVVVGKRGLTGILQQLVHRVDGAADNPLYRPHAHAFAEKGENLGALGEG